MVQVHDVQCSDAAARLPVRLWGSLSFINQAYLEPKLSPRGKYRRRPRQKLTDLISSTVPDASFKPS